jgi:hypothetical protein
MLAKTLVPVSHSEHGVGERARDTLAGFRRLAGLEFEVIIKVEVFIEFKKELRKAKDSDQVAVSDEECGRGAVSVGESWSSAPALFLLIWEYSTATSKIISGYLLCFLPGVSFHE